MVARLMGGPAINVGVRKGSLLYMIGSNMVVGRDEFMWPFVIRSSDPCKGVQLPRIFDTAESATVHRCVICI